MPIMTWDRVLKIILTILNILTSCLGAFGVQTSVDPSDDSEGHA